jgi:hypothetical protein
LRPRQPFGIPQDVMRRLADRHIPVFRTDAGGEST